MTVSVLESCSTASEYKEDFATLTAQIAPFLAGPGEPTEASKAELAALLRRLVEVVVNRFAFNDERHQYKQKSQQVSDFPKFTKLVPLLPAEAEKLRDIYANLSPTEHDDPRNFYTGRGRLQFKTWQRIRRTSGPSPSGNPRYGKSLRPSPFPSPPTNPWWVIRSASHERRDIEAGGCRSRTRASIDQEKI